ncbi:MAG: 30S ribosomal protein S10 [Alphaproteobacteria bacterium]|nr:30S ribosomal protein S10 [Rickettsiales bacterium]
MSSVTSSVSSAFDQKSQNVKIRLSSFASSILDKATMDLVIALRKVSAMVVGPIPLPNSIVTMPVNRSPHVDGQSKEKMRIVRHYRMLIILNATSAEIDAISSINIASGVGIEIQVTARKKKTWK